MQSKGMVGMLAALAALGWCAASGGAAGDVHEDATQTAERTRLELELIGFTAPAREAALGPLVDGRIAAIHVREGAQVAEGALLVQLEDDVQRVRAETARNRAASELGVESAQLQVRHAQRELERIRRLREDNLASAQELADAQLALDLAKNEHAQAVFRKQQAELDYELQSLLVERHRIAAPFRGYIAAVRKHVGESIEEREPTVKIVQLDPLEITVDWPLERFDEAVIGRRCWVKPTDPHFAPREAVITNVNRVMDKASQTFPVKLEASNPEGKWIAGLRVVVEPAAGRIVRAADAQPRAGAHSPKSQ